MKKIFKGVVLAIAFLAAGCSTTQEVTLVKNTSTKQIRSVAITPEADNSTQMNANVEAAFLSAGLTVKSPLASGVKKSGESDAIVSYVDVWRWDVIMYLKELSVKMYDAETGDLMALGSWKNSPLHGFQDAKLVVKELVDEVLVKLKSANRDSK